MQEATEEELEKLLDKIMVLFRFIHGNVGLGLLFFSVSLVPLNVCFLNLRAAFFENSWPYAFMGCLMPSLIY